MLKKRRLGTSDLEVSELSLGCMSLGTDKGQAESIIKTAIEEGINFFDTADLYDFGENEKIIGSVLQPFRDKVILATKVGNRWNEGEDGWQWDPSKTYIKEAVKNSLKRLNTDYIDLYQLHGGTIEDRIDETIEAFEELKAEGFIRYYGISSIRPNVIREYVQKSNMVSVMMQYSLLDRRPEEEALPLLHQNGISVITRGSLAKGLLSDRMLEKTSPSIGEKGYLDYSFSEVSALVEKLKVAFHRPLNEIALHYNLANPAVASVVVGASSVQQLKQNVQAIKSNELTTDEINQLRSLTKSTIYQDHR
ncbi:aldo/keto reductase [Niallia sp. Krafla_26]|uniref:aldo/keto reductase n=1 Tax=Niallia sp. Krafla_26 TaxID=3064703 RepID=UPI003D1811A9